ncbi:MAG: hypothetical protein AAF267_19505 [Deinococcota bacterium]
MNRKAISLVLGLVVAVLLAACSESLNGSVDANYLLLPIDSSDAIYGGSMQISYDDGLELVDVVTADGDTISVTDMQDGTLTVALASANPKSGRLATVVFQGSGSVTTSSFEAVTADFGTKSLTISGELISSPEAPANISTQQLDGVLIPATADLQGSFANFELGDYDQSGAVALIDVVRILQVLTGEIAPGSISDYQYFISDFTANGRIDLLDAIAALQKVVGSPANLVVQTSDSLAVGTTVTLVLFNAGSDSFSTTPVINAPADVTVTGPSPSISGQSFAYSVAIGSGATGSLTINAGGANQASLPIQGGTGGGGTGDPLLDIVFYTTDTSTAVNPNPITGQLTVRANFDLGGAEAERIELLLNGVVAQSQPVLGTQSQADLSVDTSAFDCDTLTPDYPNGDYDISARLVLANNSFVNARNGNTGIFGDVPFGNADTVELEILSGNSVEASGVTWYGGGDVEFRVCPIIYDIASGTSVETVVVNPQRDNGSDTLNIGAGAGLPRNISRGTAPNFFTFTAAQAPNSNYEDSRAPVRRTTFFEVDALDAGSLNIASLVSDEFYLDFRGPQVTGQVQYRRFNFGTNTTAPFFQTTAVPLSTTNLADTNRYIGPRTPIAAPATIEDEGVGLPVGYQPGIDVIPGNATNVLATLAVSDTTTGQDLANELNIFTSTAVVTPISGFQIQLTSDTEDRLGNTIAGTEIDESRSGLLGFDFDAPAIANVGPAPATNANAGGIYSNSFLPVLAIGELAAGAGPIVEPDGFGAYIAGEDFVFNSIFRAEVTDTNSGLDDADATNDVDTFTSRSGVTDDDFGDPANAGEFTTTATTPPALDGNSGAAVDIIGNIETDTPLDVATALDGPFDKTLAVRQNGVVLPLVAAADAAAAVGADDPDGNFDNNGYALDLSGGTLATANTYNFVQSGSSIGDAQVNLNVIFYDAVGNATTPSAPDASTNFSHEIDRTEPDVSFQSYVTPVALGGSPTVTSSGSIRITDANIDLNNSYVIIQRDDTDGTFGAGSSAAATVLVNGQTMTIDPTAAPETSFGSLTFAQSGLTSSAGFQPLELTFETPGFYRLIIRSTDLSRQLDEADVTTDDDTLPQIVSDPAALTPDSVAPTILGFGNTANDATTIEVQ